MHNFLTVSQQIFQKQTDWDGTNKSSRQGQIGRFRSLRFWFEHRAYTSRGNGDNVWEPSEGGHQEVEGVTSETRRCLSPLNCIQMKGFSVIGGMFDYHRDSGISKQKNRLSPVHQLFLELQDQDDFLDPVNIDFAPVSESETRGEVESYKRRVCAFSSALRFHSFIVGWGVGGEITASALKLCPYRGVQTTLRRSIERMCICSKECDAKHQREVCFQMWCHGKWSVPVVLIGSESKETWLRIWNGKNVSSDAACSPVLLSWTGELAQSLQTANSNLSHFRWPLTLLCGGWNDRKMFWNQILAFLLQKYSSTSTEGVRKTEIRVNGNCIQLAE